MRIVVGFLLLLGLALDVIQEGDSSAARPSQDEDSPTRPNVQRQSETQLDRAAIIRRGGYLANSVAMCTECHTPRDAAGQLDLQRRFQGSTIPLRSPFPNGVWAFSAPRIAGLPGRSEEDVSQLLETGTDSRGWSPRGPMPPFRLSAEDAAAVAAYLASLR